ncbi:hypothetical protein KVR01_013583 [Diaporthe batatas]|uniref:uncharacterized protein n=1 Tax=Diaporthe batatas TaxID=748121 RepID=UPI001D0534FB|nr:uncharacterized protein KVR01_013583 [Diaporthe batatas]KAG8156479.1 hypothetical protein KVR01_013583 [Diaporthe batatas]
MAYRSLKFVLFGSLLGLSRAGEPYPERDEVCLSACEHTLDKQTFVPSSANEDAKAEPCTNDLHLQSLYICAQSYCEQRDVQPGWDFLSHTCRHEGYPALPPLSSFVGISTTDAKTINSTSKGKKLNTTVLADEKFWDLVLEGTTLRAQARWTNRSHQEAAYIFWGIVMGLAAVFNLGSRLSVVPPAFVSRILRPVRAHLSIPPVLAKAAQPVPSRLEALIIAAFFVISLILCAVEIHRLPGSWIYVSFKERGDQAQILSLIARRSGDMAIANLALIWLFSMRNNPLILITGWSFATFNQFHRWIARITFLELVVHAGVFTKYQFVKGGLTRYKYVYQQLEWWVMGVVSLVFFSLVLGFAAAPSRAKFYDSFLLMHILMAVVFFATLWYHVEPQFFTDYLWPIVAIWPLERLLRAARSFITGAKGMASVSADNSAGLVRVDVTTLLGKRTPTPGSTYYMYTPTRFPFYQSHPFTLVAFPNAPGEDSTSSLEEEKGPGSVSVHPVPGPYERLNYRFLIAPQKGFTKRLNNYIVKGQRTSGEESASQRVPILLEGPYKEEAESIDFHSCRDILLVIGGSGISVGLSCIYRALSIPETTSVTLVWSVRNSELIRSVANEELQCALRDSRFTLKG